MNTYIAFLRGINVSGQKRIKMIDLRASLQRAGLMDVRSYIQSGNIVFKTTIGTIGEMESLIDKAIKDDFGFNVPTLVKTAQSIMEILQRNPFIGVAGKGNQYFALLHQIPKKPLVEKFNALNFENEEFCLTKKCVYLNCKQGAGKAKLNNALIENKLRLTATTRNLNTMLKMVEMANLCNRQE